MRQMQRETRNTSGSGYHGAASTWTRVNFSETAKMHLYLYTVPRDELDLELFLIMQRNSMLEEKYDENFLRRMGVAVEEDRVVIEKLDPAIPSKDTIGEFIVPADDIIMHYRRKLSDWQRRGWRMDLDTIARNRGRIAYSIPSPGRRSDPGEWAVTPVPLL
jgi:hypothetical protein